MDLGYIEGESIEFETIFAEGRTDQLPALAMELVQLKVDVIVTTTVPAVRARGEAGHDRYSDRHRRRR